jgi:hypothetical protein
MPYSLLADVVVALHVAYVGYVVLGQLAIWLGLLLHWRWVRNPWFRWSHLVMMTFVAFEAVLNITCPLTTLEEWLRRRDGAQSSGVSFVGRLLQNLIFVDATPDTLAALHVTFAVIVIATFVLAWPRSFRAR